MWTTPECRHKIGAAWEAAPCGTGISAGESGASGASVGRHLLPELLPARRVPSRQCAAEIIRQNVLVPPMYMANRSGATLGTGRPGGGGAGQPGRAPSGSRLRMHKAVLFQATKSHPAKLGFGVKNLPPRGIGIHQQGGRLCPGESPLVPHSVAAAFQRPAVRGWIPAPRSRRTQRVPSLRKEARLPQQAQQGTPAPGGGGGKA